MEAVGSAQPKPKRTLVPGADGIPYDMCPRCGLRCGRQPHGDYRACIDALRDLVARLQFRSKGLREHPNCGA